MSLSKRKIKVAHLSSVHSRYDVRVFLKQCSSLAGSGYAVSLVVADGRGDEHKNGVAIYDVGPSNGRIDRMRNTARRVLLKAVALNADIYHLHDPELIPAGLKLKKMGKTIVFDSHEDVPADILSKPYMSHPVRVLVSRVFAAYEARACRKYDAIVGATPHIRDKFAPVNPLSVNINNFPVSGEFASEADWGGKRRQVCYMGGLESARGLREMVLAMSKVDSDVRLQLAGRFQGPRLEREVKTWAGWSKVDALGHIDRATVRVLLSQSVAGLLIFLPVPNHTEAQPNKMFEYMSAGIPVIGSYFPLWREIIEGNKCGLCVDPLDPEAIAKAIDFVMGHPDSAKQMGENGRQAVKSRYNWAIEEKKLLALYERLV